MSPWYSIALYRILVFFKRDYANITMRAQYFIKRWPLPVAEALFR